VTARPAPALALLLLAACRASPTATAETPGDRLERAATAAGLVHPGAADPVGLWARDDDRVCVVRGRDGGLRLGAVSRFDDGQGCTGAGAATAVDGGLRVELAPGCRLTVAIDDTAMRFPAEVPAACADACIGRATFSALEVERLSASADEAAAMDDGRGGQPCGG
jgi:hypothetical protein